MDKSKETEEILNVSIQHQVFLYTKGFLITNQDFIEKKEIYPFYNNWRLNKIKNYWFWIHQFQKSYFFEKEDICFFLIGHAYNPFTMDYEEEKILEKMANAYQESFQKYIDILNELTGVFVIGIVEEEKMIIFNDCAGMQTVFYGFVNEKMIVSSHTQLIGDLCNLEMDLYVKELISYKFYPLFGRWLPGDISPYERIIRLVPNNYIIFQNNEFMHYRFYPINKINECSDDEYPNVVSETAKILNNNMKLIHKKWLKPAISLSGGCDSQTTLACTNGEYDHYQYFSYSSILEEDVDAKAAQKICCELGLKHKIYNISNQNEDFKDLEIFRKILEMNSGNIGKNNANDIRKRIFFINNEDFDVEIKSWVSEITRAYYCKRFVKKNFSKKPTPRMLTTLYKVFMHNRKLVKKTDKIFQKFLKKYYQKDEFKKINWVDLFFWEYRISGWNGLVITGEHNISFDITIPYNNRKLIEQLLSIKNEKRIKDEAHQDIIIKMNENIKKINISVVNVKHTKLRALCEKMYLTIHSKLPF